MISNRLPDQRARTAKNAQLALRGGALRQLINYLSLSLIFILLGVAAVYYYGSLETRTSLENTARDNLDSLRRTEWMPQVVVGFWDKLYQSVPSSEGMVVEAGLTTASESPVLAGIPKAPRPTRTLYNLSYINLYDEVERKPLCIMTHVQDPNAFPASAPQNFVVDTRVGTTTAEEMRLGKWAPHPIVPTELMSAAFGETGASESQLSTQLVPVPDAFANGIWRQAIQNAFTDYANRFGEVWIYAGPVYQETSSMLSSGILIPDAFYLICFDRTASGGIRSLAFLIPTDAPTEAPLKDYISSIERIEVATGLQFLPDLPTSTQDLLRDVVSSKPW